MKIACLHTAQSNIAVFEEAARELGLRGGSLRHEVRPDLLLAAEDAGGLTPDLERETASILKLLGQEADAVVLTCSTLGPSVHGLEESTAVPIIRADAALAEQALDAGGTTIALCAVETTLKPTMQLFAEAARRSGASFEVRLVPGAWALFKAGKHDEYLSAIAKAADAAYNDGATTVALAQASMAAAAGLVQCGPKALTSPIAGLRAVLEQISQQGTSTQPAL
jgi:Asp/Glu/Hydantoin racemase